MSAHPDAPRIIQSNEVAGIVITATEKVHPGEFVTLDLRYGIADALWDAGYRKVEVTELDNRIAEAKEIVGPDARLADPYALGKLDGLLIAQSVLGLTAALGGAR